MAPEVRLAAQQGGAMQARATAARAERTRSGGRTWATWMRRATRPPSRISGASRRATSPPPALSRSVSDCFGLMPLLHPKMLGLPRLMLAVCTCKCDQVSEVLTMHGAGCQWALWCDSSVPGQC